MASPKIWYLERNTDEGEVFWKAAVNGSAAIFAEGAVGEPGVSEIKPYESEEEAVAAVVKLVACKVAAGFIDKSPHTTEPADVGAGAGAGAGAGTDTSAGTSAGVVGVQAGYVRLWSLVKEDEPDNLFWRATVSGPGCTIASGVVGSLGGSEVKSFSSAAEAVAAVEKLAEAQLKAGYRNVLPEASTDGSAAEAAVAVAAGEAAGDSTVKPDDADCWDGIHPELVEQFKRIGCTCKAPPAKPRSARVNFTPPGGEMREVSIEEDLLRVLYDVHFPNKHFWRQSDVDDGEPEGQRHYWEAGPGPLCTPGQIYLYDEALYPVVPWMDMSNAWQACVDLRSSGKPSNPTIVNLDHEELHSEHEYVGTPMSAFLAGLKPFDPK